MAEAHGQAHQLHKNKCRRRFNTQLSKECDELPGASHPWPAGCDKGGTPNMHTCAMPFSEYCKAHTLSQNTMDARNMECWRNGVGKGDSCVVLVRRYSDGVLSAGWSAHAERCLFPVSPSQKKSSVWTRRITKKQYKQW